MKSVVDDPRLGAVADSINQDRLIGTAVELVSISSPTGHEQGCADYVAEQLRGAGMTIAWQQVEEGRPNVIGTLEGSSGEPSLMFAGHLDTSYSGREPWAGKSGFKPEPQQRHGRIFGLGISNMKGALAAYIEVVRAIRDSGTRLRGDLLIAGVCGEIEKTQWGEYQGPDFRGYGVGSRALVVNGVVPDLCILGEATEGKLVLGHFGTMWVSLSVSGPFVHSAWSGPHAKENSILRMLSMLPAIEDWISEWTLSAREAGVAAVVNIGAIRGGYPWRVSRTPAQTELFLDMRVPPSMPMQHARASFMRLVATLRKRFPDHGVKAQTYLAAPGTILDGTHPLVSLIEQAHASVFGVTPERDIVRWFCDASAFAAHGIPTVIYGPSSGLPGPEGESLDVSELTNFTKAYALAAASLCGVDS